MRAFQSQAFARNPTVVDFGALSTPSGEGESVGARRARRARRRARRGARTGRHPAAYAKVPRFAPRTRVLRCETADMGSTPVPLECFFSHGTQRAGDRCQLALACATRHARRAHSGLRLPWTLKRAAGGARVRSHTVYR